MFWGRRIVRGIVVLALLGAWAGSLAQAASANKRTFLVQYIGEGHYTSKNKTLVACGSDTRDEDTHFSWVAAYRFDVSFSSRGFATVKDHTDPVSRSGADNSSTVKLSGCSGQADCQGESRPAPNTPAQLKLTGAGPGGRSRLTAGAIGLNNGLYGNFTGFKFTGTFSSGGNCADYIKETGLVNEQPNASDELMAGLPVKYSTLHSLKKGHYFRVLIHPGHYAKAHHNYCQPSDGCESEDFSWSATVHVQRVS